MFFFSNKLKGKGTRCSFSEAVSIEPKTVIVIVQKFYVLIFSFCLDYLEQ